MIVRKAKARLDTDGTAQPLTQITQHFKSKKVDTGYVIQKQSYLDHYEIHDIDQEKPRHSYADSCIEGTDWYVCDCGLAPKEDDSKLSWWKRLKLELCYYFGLD